jgi:hypothetical protein
MTGKIGSHYGVYILGKGLGKRGKRREVSSKKEKRDEEVYGVG